ncbi:MAG TPA: energy-coupled thiamine transporter ThiT [Acholeplasmataceae bacterium]|jgi:thiamine transporter|nr:energy-coupled thiamine transporter ThiT [Acholeplasmataceae bacterium]
MKKRELRFITEVGLFTALGLTLDFLAGWYSNFIFPSGGSISLAMVAIFIVSFRWGLKGGLTAGFLVGALQLLYSEVFGYGFDWKVVTGIVLLDYILAYTACGLAGIFAGKARQKSDGSGGLGFVTNGILFAAAIRTLCHIVSGLLFFREWIPEFILEDYVWWYWSIIYNLGFMAPSTLLCIIATHALFAAFSRRLLDVDQSLFGR